MASGIVQLFAASAAFLGTHVALSHPLRQPLVGRLGENGRKIGNGLFCAMGTGASGPKITDEKNIFSLDIVVFSCKKRKEK